MAGWSQTGVGRDSHCKATTPNTEQHKDMTWWRRNNRLASIGTNRFGDGLRTPIEQGDERWRLRLERGAWHLASGHDHDDVHFHDEADAQTGAITSTVDEGGDSSIGLGDYAALPLEETPLQTFVAVDTDGDGACAAAGLCGASAGRDEVVNRRLGWQRVELGEASVVVSSHPSRRRSAQSSATCINGR